MTDYYDVNLKYERLKILDKYENFYSYKNLIQDKIVLQEISDRFNPKIIIHLAAQAGVRFSIENPISYTESNLLGTFHILELARKLQPDHFLIASTSSVYGNNQQLPFEENQKCDNPISYYAATKKANEVMAHSYSHLYNIPTTIFRFFTVYGPWGRPDMALFKFTKNILLGKSIDVYNNGNMKRDFTYIHDLVRAINLLINVIPPKLDNRKSILKNDSLSNTAPYRIVNIGNAKPTNLLVYIQELENKLGILSNKNFLEMQDGDVVETHSNINLLNSLTGFSPKISLKKGISDFVDWYKSYYKY